MDVSPYNILSLYLRLLIRMEWECVMLSWVPWRRSTSMRRVRRTTVTATERCHYHPISCQQNYETLFFTDNIQCVIWPGSHSNWLETGDRERQSRGEKVQIHKAAKIQYTTITRLRPWKPPCVLQCPWKISTREGGLSYLLHFNVFQYISAVSAVFQRYRRVWRDKRLAALAKLKRDMEREEAASN